MIFLVIDMVLLAPLAMASAFNVGTFFLPSVVLGWIATATADLGH